MNMPADWNDLILTAIVPVYNEEATLEVAVGRIRDVPLNIDVVRGHEQFLHRFGDIFDTFQASFLRNLVHQLIGENSFFFCDTFE